MVWRKRYTEALTLGFVSLLLLHMCGFAWLQAGSLCVLAVFLTVQPLREDASPRADVSADTTLVKPVMRFVPFTCSVRIDIDACLQKLEIAEQIYEFVGTPRFASVFATATVVAYSDYSGSGPDPLLVLKREIDSQPRYSTHLELRWEIEEADFKRSNYSEPGLNRAIPHLLRVVLTRKGEKLKVALGYPKRWAKDFLPAGSPGLKAEPGISEFDYIFRTASELPWQVLCSFLEVPSGSDPIELIGHLQPGLSVNGWTLDATYPLSLEDGCVDYRFSHI